MRKAITSIFLVCSLILSGILPVQANEGFQVRARESGMLVADQDTRYITVFEQDPDSKIITATVRVQNNNLSEALVINGVAMGIRFTNKVSPYNMITNIPFRDGILVDNEVSPYGDILCKMDIFSTQILTINAEKRVIGAKIAAVTMDRYLTVAPRTSEDVYSYYFMPEDGADLDIGMFEYVSNYYQLPRRISTWIGNEKDFMAADKAGVGSIMDGSVEVYPEAYKIHVKRTAPVGLSADNRNRKIFGYDEAVMEWSDVEGGPFMEGHPAVPDEAATIYVRQKGDSSYNLTSPDEVYKNYKKYIPSDAVAIYFNKAEEPAENKSANPEINAVYDYDTVVTGTGIAGAEITVTFPDGDTSVVTVDSYGNWSADIPEGLILRAGDEVSAIQKEEGKEFSDYVTATVLPGIVQSDIPAINVIREGDYVVTGTGVPHAEIIITFPDGQKVSVFVDENCSWSADVPEGIELLENDEISAVQKENNKLISNAITAIVQGKDSILEQSEVPAIDLVYEGDAIITGTGVPYAEVTVTFPDGTDESAVVGADGIWSVNVPSRINLEERDEISAVQKEENKDLPSNKITTTVLAKEPVLEQSKTPVIDSVYESDVIITGTGVPYAEITVTFPDGTKESAVVDGNGIWSVNVPNWINLMERDEISAVQKEENKDLPSNKITAIVKPKIAVFVAVTFDPTGGGPQPGVKEVQLGLTYGTLPTVTRNGYLFDGWFTEKTGGNKVNSVTIVANGQNHTLYAHWTSDEGEPGGGDSGGSGGGGGTSYYTVTYKAGQGSGRDYTVSNLRNGQQHTVLSDIVTGFNKTGYTFSKWTVNSDGSGTSYNPSDQIRITGNVTLYAQWINNPDNEINTEESLPDADIPLGLIKLEHLVYLRGYPDKTVRPDNSITRAEAAMIFFMLLDDAQKYDPVDSNLEDVLDGQWYSQAVNYLSKLGVIQGYPDKTFRPNQPITRAEFSVLASKFDKLSGTNTNAFADVPSAHWAIDFINSAYVKGWINGYPDKTFRPEKQITRAEVVSIVNAMLDRKIKPENIAGELNKYSDLSEEHWAYSDILEASVLHNYVKDSAGFEIWTIN